MKAMERTEKGEQHICGNHRMEIDTMAFVSGSSGPASGSLKAENFIRKNGFLSHKSGPNLSGRLDRTMR
jgi:hypothetical protein